MPNSSYEDLVRRLRDQGGELEELADYLDEWQVGVEEQRRESTRRHRWRTLWRYVAGLCFLGQFAGVLWLGSKAGLGWYVITLANVWLWIDWLMFHATQRMQR